jgi:hypothetical protein
MKNNTYSRRSQIVSTVKKSQATIPAACWRRNPRQVVVARRGAGSSPQRRADRGRRDLHTKVLELALDALVAPARILLGQADDELVDAVVERWSPLSMTRVGPRACDEAAVPAQQRLGLHEEARPASPRQRAADRSQQRPIGGLQPGSWNLAAEHGELVTQDKDLKILGGVTAGELGEELDVAAQCQVGKSWQHRGASAVGAAETPR